MHFPMIRVFDILFALTGLVLGWPLLALITLIGLLDTGAPLFRQQRVGRFQQPFTLIKFRTMRPGTASVATHLASRSAITPLGRFLRRSKLDELPQLWNVLKGEMSLVGPRPSPFRENQICVPWREGRLSVRPGITGLWQVCRHDRDAGDFHQWIEYDLLYVQHMSMMLDLKVLTATVLTLGGKYPVRVDRFVPGAAALAVTVVPRTYDGAELVARAADAPAPPTRRSGASPPCPRPPGNPRALPRRRDRRPTCRNSTACEAWRSPASWRCTSSTTR